jgi:hypothetical protein
MNCSKCLKVKNLVELKKVSFLQLASLMIEFSAYFKPNEHLSTQDEMCEKSVKKTIWVGMSGVKHIL